MSLSQKWLLDLIQTNSSFLWSVVLLFIFLHITVCVCVCGCLSVWWRALSKAGCRLRSVNLAALLSSTCDRKRGGHRSVVAAPAGPIRRELVVGSANAFRHVQHCGTDLLMDSNMLSTVSVALCGHSYVFSLIMKVCLMNVCSPWPHLC